MKKLILFLVFLYFPTVIYAQCAGVTSCSTVANPTGAQIQAALNSINLDGTVLTIPAGSSTISSTISYTQTNSFTLQGAGTVTGTCAPGSTSSSGCVPTDSTVLIDTVNHNSGDPPMLTITTLAGKSIRITGIAFATNGSSTESFNGVLRFSGNSTSFRLDHLHLNLALDATEMVIGGCVYGVMDHSVQELPIGGTGGQTRTIQGSCGSDSLGVGNGQWNEASALGTGNSFYFENNVFNGGNNAASTVMPFVNDCFNGGRFVARYNSIYAATLQGHATGHANNPPSRSCRAYEIYQNYFGSGGSMSSSNPGYGAFYNTGGTGVLWGNQFAGFYQAFVNGNIDRTNNGTYGQSTPPAGWGYCSSTPIGGVPGPSNWDGNASGQNGWPCLDQIGRGQGDLLQGSFSTVCDATSTDCTNGIYTGRWPNQSFEPVYEWLDQWQCNFSGCRQVWAQQNAQASPNRDFYLYTLTWNGTTFTGTAFNGTSGVGSGTLTPTTSGAYSGAPNCTAGPGGAYGSGITGSPGVGYWVTPNGPLYVCTATNTWTSYYAPYQYPHPLITPQVATPICSPTSGAPPQTVSCSTTTPSAVICYITNGSTPTAPTAGTCGSGSTTYAGPISISVNPTTLQLLGTLSGDSNSSIVSYIYTSSTVATPTFSPVAGTYAGTQSVSITTSTSGSTICYTTNGTTPAATTPGTCSTGTTLANGGSISVSVSETVMAIGTKSGLINSAVASAAYVITGLPTASAPVFSLPSGTYSGTQMVSITSSAATVICYGNGTVATNGSNGCTSGTLYTGTISVPISQTINAIAGGTGYLDSSVTSVSYTITAPPTFGPAAAVPMILTP